MKLSEIVKAHEMMLASNAINGRSLRRRNNGWIAGWGNHDQKHNGIKIACNDGF